MPNSTQLSEHEKRQIIDNRKCGMSGHEIARKIYRSETVIHNILKNQKECGKKKLTGRPPTLTISQKREITRRACLEKQNSTRVKTELNLPCTSGTV